jgi:Fe-S-cluster-containing dehydrogenase component/anaerobic selenocysteine-containing dehydrogenase
MNRRNFLKALGLGTGASALSACGIDDNVYFTPIEQILPYVVKPADAIPGTPTFFATTVTRGPDAHPVLAKHRDGRVINVGANRQATWTMGVGKGPLLELQKHYSPDRTKGPRAGGDEGAALTWEDGIQQVVAAVQAAKAAGKQVAWLGGYRSGSMVDLIARVCDRTVFWEPLGYEADANAAQAVFGQRVLPRYDLADATYVLSFGADFLSGWGGPHLAAGFSKARNAAHGGHVARFALVAPYRDQTGAKADDWHAVTPGSQALVARAVAASVAQKKGYTGPALAALGSVDAAAAAAAAGIDAAVIEQIAAQFAAGASVALPGGTSGANAAATELAAATYLLNIVGGAAPNLFHLGGYQAPVHNTADLESLVADLKAGKVGVLFVDDANPVYALPGLEVVAAIQKADLSVAFTSHPDETTAACKLVLPAADAFEDWGDEQPFAGLTLLRQPSMGPLRIAYLDRKPHAADQVEHLWDVRSAGEVMVAVGKATGSVTEGNWRDFLRARWAMNAYEPLVAAPAREQAAALAAANGTPVPEASPMAIDATRGFQDWMASALSVGFISFPHPSIGVVPEVVGQIAWQAAVAPAGSGDLHLHVAPHAHIRDGRFANSPWAQEVPDPLTGQVWGSWVEIHPDTAANLGLRDNDQVTLTTDAGKVEVGVEVTRSVRPDVVAVHFGQGHKANGRYATGMGVSAAELVPLAKDPQGARAWQATKVAVAKTGAKAALVSTFGHDSDEDRNFAVRVNAKQYEAAHGDAPAGHPGELTGIHHLKLDKRLVEAGITDFYGLTDHPTYRFGMAVDTDQCTGCGACAVACYAENNLPVVGRDKVKSGRVMGWIRVNRYYKGDETFFVPMMCQHCGHAPCESVCPVLATYHNLDGLNAMVYNRCVGTRYCSNACPFSVRRFNYHSYVWPEPFNMQLNPDVTTRTMGVMEKCTFCVQRIRSMKTAYKDRSSTRTDFAAVVPDAALRKLPACAEACPSDALTFGNLNDEASFPSTTRKSARVYYPLEDINVFSAVNYLAKVSFHAPEAGHGGGHATDQAGHGEPAHAAPAHAEPTHGEPAKADH